MYFFFDNAMREGGRRSFFGFFFRKIYSGMNSMKTIIIGRSQSTAIAHDYTKTKQKNNYKNSSNNFTIQLYNVQTK